MALYWINFYILSENARTEINALDCLKAKDRTEHKLDLKTSF